jgi:ABC-type polar amino acid transport system ATPase subunit
MSAVLEVRGLSARRGARDVLAGVDVSASRGDLIALMGLSGTGKTTLLRAVAGLDPFDAGTIRVDDLELGPGPGDASQVAQVRRRLGMVFQAHALFEHLSAIENVCLALIHVQQMARAAAAVHAQDLLDRLGVGGRAHARPGALSGGEAQRVAIARALAMDPPLLLLDEPTASLDPARRLDLGRRLRALAVGGRALVITSHDEDFVREHATRVLVLAAGRVVEAGDPRDVLDRPTHPATRALLRHEMA